MRNIVVGVDGTSVAAHALDWAASAAGPNGRLHAVTAVSPVTELVVDAGLADSYAYRQLLQRELESGWTRGVHDRVRELTAIAVESWAAEALISAAEEHHADAIVVGAHVPVRSLPKTIGRTIRNLLRELPCPLIVVPQTADVRLGDGAPIIVGAGHGEATEAAVRWAARLADERGLAMGLVRATGEGPVFQVDGLLDLLTLYLDPSKRDEWTREDLASFAVEAQESTVREIPIAVSATPGLPATQLVEASRNAALLVIGQHRSLLPGSRVVQPLRYALAHARCPVAVIPGEASGHESEN